MPFSLYLRSSTYRRTDITLFSKHLFDRCLPGWGFAGRDDNRYHDHQCSRFFSLCLLNIFITHFTVTDGLVGLGGITMGTIVAFSSYIGRWVYLYL